MKIQIDTGTRLIPKSILRVIGAMILMLVLVSYRHQAAPGNLKQAATEMSAPSWKKIHTQGLSQDLFDVGNGYHILEFIEEACWDPLTEQVMFIGQGQMSQLKHIVYQDSIGCWREEPRPYWASNIGHGYDHNAINPVAGHFYFHPFNSNQVYRYHIASKTWTALPTMPDALVCCLGMEYFPEMKGLILAGGGKIYFYSEQKQEWQILASGLAMGPYHNFAEYNPVHKVMLLGGGNGSRDIYKMDSTGQVIALKSAPLVVGIGNSINTVDPVSGDYLIFGKKGEFYRYDIVHDDWQLLSTTPQFGQISGTIACPISSYGVILFLTYTDGNPKVFLYKHANLSDAVL